MRELERLLRIEAAARALWNAHFGDPAARRWTQYCGKDSAELFALGRALGVVSALAPDGQQDDRDRKGGDDQVDASH